MTPRFATRLNSFSSNWPNGHGKPRPIEVAERAFTADGLTDVDLSYPDRLGPDEGEGGRRSRGLAFETFQMIRDALVCVPAAPDLRESGARGAERAGGAC